MRFSLRFLGAAENVTGSRYLLEADGLRGRSGPGRAIVYCSTRKTTDKVAKALRSSGFAAGHYHAGRTKLAREQLLRFARNPLESQSVIDARLVLWRIDYME